MVDKAEAHTVPGWLSDVFKGSEHALTMFSVEELTPLKAIGKNGKLYIQCAVSEKLRLAKPEEVVRQLILVRLIKRYKYPKQRISVEKPVYFGSTVHEKAADIVISDKDNPYHRIHYNRS